MAWLQDNSFESTAEMAVEPLYNALSAIKTLRSNVAVAFESLGNGIRSDHGEEGKETKFLLELQDQLTVVNNNLRYSSFILT